MNFLMSAPAEKNFSLALWTITTRVAPATASSTALENSLMNSRSYELAGGLSRVMKPSGPSDVNVTAIYARPPTTTDLISTYESSASIPCSLP